MKVTTAEIVAMRQAAAQPDAGAALLERRAALDAELDRLGAAGHAAAEAMQRLAELDGEELALTQATRIAWEAWAHNPDTSPPQGNRLNLCVTNGGKLNCRDPLIRWRMSR